MNVVELVEEVLAIIDDPDYTDTEKITKRLNEAQRAVADAIMLPDLNNGIGTVDTAVDAYEVAMPADYQQNLYLAYDPDGEDLDVYKDMASMELVRKVRMDTGDLEAVCVHGSVLIYQPVPTAITTISLRYYRLPTDMVADDETSYPDGARGNDDFEWALVHHAAWKIFNKIEDGLEGQKVNTAAQLEQFGQRMTALDSFAERVGKSFPTRPASVNLGWLGAN